MSSIFFELINVVFGICKVLLYKLLYFTKFKINTIPKVNFSTNFNIKGKSKIILGKKFRSRNNVSLYSYENGKISIGNNVFFNENCVVSCRNLIDIGDNCIFGNNVSIYDNDHDYKHNLNEYITAPITIGKNTWCGCNVIILKGNSIGKNCIIGAGTIVNKDIPDNSIVYTKKELMIKNKEIM